MRRVVFAVLIVFLASFLRLYGLGVFPPSLYWDEASLGYNAYTIAHWGRDEHGEFFPLARFTAFGDYKPPGYIYAAAVSVKALGMSEYAIRLPSSLAGIGLAFATYFLVLALFHNSTMALLSSFLFSVSPWSLHLSRGAFEANLAAFLHALGVLFFLQFRKTSWKIVPSLLFFTLSFLTFNANRVIAPLTVLCFFLLYFKRILSETRWVAAALLLSFLLVAPSIPYLESRESTLRFQEVTIFSDPEPVLVSNDRIADDGGQRWAKIIHNRRVLFSINFLKHYFDTFSGRFLFTHGDVNPRLHVGQMGQLFVWEFPLLILGVYFLISKRERSAYPLLLWLLLVPLPAASARETPHALRTISLVPVLHIVEAYGFYHIVRKGKSYASSFFHLGIFLFLGAFFLTFYFYLHIYYVHFPVIWSGEWQYGYKEMVTYVTRVQNQYDSVYVTDALGRPYIYFALYGHYPVSQFLDERRAVRDWYGFWNVSQLGTIHFDLSTLRSATGRVLLVTTPHDFPVSFREMKRIYNLSGDAVFVIGDNR